MTSSRLYASSPPGLTEADTDCAGAAICFEMCAVGSFDYVEHGATMMWTEVSAIGGALRPSRERDSVIGIGSEAGAHMDDDSMSLQSR